MSETAAAETQGGGGPPKGPYPLVVARAGPIESVMAAGVVLAGLGAAVLLHGQEAPLSQVLCALAVAAVGMMWVAGLALRRTTVFETHLAQTSLLGTLRLERSEITGWRVAAGARAAQTTLILTSTRPPGVFYIVDPNGAEYRSWIGDLPKLDKTGPELIVGLMEQSPVLGPDPETRRRRVALAKTATLWATYAVFGLTLLVFALTPPEGLQLALAVTPILALACAWLVTRLRARTLSGEAVGLPSRWLVPTTMITCMAGFGAGPTLLRHGLLDPWLLIFVGAVACLPVFAALVWLDRGWLRASKPGIMAVLLVATAVWAAGLLADVNRLADRSQGHAYVTRINELHTTRSRHATNYHAVLAGWAGRTRPEDTEVSYDLYQQLREGGAMCVTQHDGALGFAWFTDRPCPQAPGGRPAGRSAS